MRVTVIGAKGLPRMDTSGKADPYCKIFVGGTEVKVAVVLGNSSKALVLYHHVHAMDRLLLCRCEQAFKQRH